MERPYWVDSIVSAWGEPVLNTSTPTVALHVDGRGVRERRYTREWIWRGTNDAAWGVRLWNTSPRLHDARMVLEAAGPVGSVLYSRPGAEMPLVNIVSSLQMAGIPPFDKGVSADLTSQQRVNYAQASTATPDEGEHMGTEGQDYQGEAHAAPASTEADTYVAGQTTDPNQVEDASAADTDADVDTTGRDEHDSNATNDSTTDVE